MERAVWDILHRDSWLILVLIKVLLKISLMNLQI